MNFLSAIRWRPGIGDPTFVGWFTVWAYFLAAFLAGWAAKASCGMARQHRLHAPAVWICVCVLMAFLAVNKQLDLQSLFTDIGRVVSKSAGWYDERREVQRWFVFGTLAGAGALVIWFASKFRSSWRRYALLITGLSFLLAFIVVRAISFHHVDEFLGTRAAGIKMNWLLELTGVGIVGLAAVYQIRRCRINIPADKL